MAVKYENIVPWGRSFEEYIEMFNLDKFDLDKKILGCGDGPASFNCTASTKGYKVTSVDPIYIYSKCEISARISETYNLIKDQTYHNREKFIWNKFGNIDELVKARLEAMNIFLNDYEKGKLEKRYIAGELPELIFLDNSFDIALCSHFLFLYSDNLSLKFHIEAIEEMLRVAKEVRIFPIIDTNSNISKYYTDVKDYFKDEQYLIDETTVNYEFQKGGNKMLRIYR